MKAAVKLSKKSIIKMRMRLQKDGTRGTPYLSLYHQTFFDGSNAICFWTYLLPDDLGVSNCCLDNFLSISYLCQDFQTCSYNTDKRKFFAIRRFIFKIVSKNCRKHSQMFWKYIQCSIGNTVFTVRKICIDHVFLNIKAAYA